MSPAKKMHFSLTAWATRSAFPLPARRHNGAAQRAADAGGCGSNLAEYRPTIFMVCRLFIAPCWRAAELPKRADELALRRCTSAGVLAPAPTDFKPAALHRRMCSAARPSSSAFGQLRTRQQGAIKSRHTIKNRRRDTRARFDPTAAGVVPCSLSSTVVAPT